MDAAIVLTWSAPFPGREKKALEYAAQCGEYWGKLAAEGRCTKPEWFMLPTGGGIWMVKGERRVLEELIQTDEVRRLVAKGFVLNQDWGYTIADYGSGAARFIGDYAGELENL
jgi:hypothetical protein